MKKSRLLINSFFVLVLTSMIFLGQTYSKNKIDDAKLRNAILGVWSATYERQNENGKWSLYGEALYNADGTKVSIGEVCQNDNCKTVKSTSTWEIKDGYLITTITESDNRNTPPGKKITDKIKSISSTTLIMFASDGGKQVRKKVTNPRFF